MTPIVGLSHVFTRVHVVPKGQIQVASHTQTLRKVGLGFRGSDSTIPAGGCFSSVSDGFLQMARRDLMLHPQHSRGTLL